MDKFIWMRYGPRQWHLRVGLSSQADTQFACGRTLSKFAHGCEIREGQEPPPGSCKDCVSKARREAENG